LSGPEPGDAARPGAPLALLFFGVFTGFERIFPRVRSLIEEGFGAIHPRGESPVFPFPETRTYRSTMGSGLLRRFYVLARPWPRDGLAPVKHAALAMEETVRGEGGFPVERPVNIDPGLLDECRIVLASTKDRGQRIYRGLGIWEEITLLYENGAYRPLPWTYADFRAPDYHAFLASFRDEALALSRSSRPTTAPPPAR
jgi:hypothetical protein